MIKVTVKLPGVISAERKIEKADMAAIGMKVMELQANQIAKKTDAKGKRFAPYSDAYARRKKVSVSSVTLVSNARVRPKGGSAQSGHMLHEFGVIKQSKSSVTIGWTTSRNKEKAKGNYNTRPFIGLNDKSRKALYKYIRKNILG